MTGFWLAEDVVGCYFQTQRGFVPGTATLTANVNGAQALDFQLLRDFSQAAEQSVSTSLLRSLPFPVLRSQLVHVKISRLWTCQEKPFRAL